MIVEFIHKETGFTFIEMIFVVLLLSTLLTIASLNFTDLQNQTTGQIVEVDLAVIRAAARAYYMDNQQFPVNIGQLSNYLADTPEDKYLTGSSYKLSSAGTTCKVWSVGPNKVDNNAAGDDIVKSFGP